MLNVRALVVATLALLVIVWAAYHADAQDRLPSADVALVLAVDASGSVDDGELVLQRQGYAAAIRHPDVVQAITDSAHGRILVTYFEWSGCESQTVRVAWTVIDSPASADAFAARIEGAGRVVSAGSTCVSAALRYAGNLIAFAPEDAERTVVDISGDGAEIGAFIVVANERDRLVEAGVTINALPILVAVDGSVEYLQTFYRENVVGGIGAFLQPANGFEDIEPALRRKLVQEIG